MTNGEAENNELIIGWIERLAKAYDILTTPRIGKRIDTYDFQDLEKSVNRLAKQIAVDPGKEI